MEAFANLSSSEKQNYFIVAAERENLSENIIEKDFWVCWTLKQLFSLPELRDEMIFKGGTSLSKAFHLIERFSEDIDISINKRFLGFTNEKDPEEATSNKKQQSLIKELSESCRNFVNENLRVSLTKKFSEALYKVEQHWEIECDSTDPDGLSLLFHYPSLNSSNQHTYIQNVVKIELGCRGGSEPTSNRAITPFIAEAIPNALSAPSVVITTLAAERTFWEKATILHLYAHWPQNKKIQERQSRHLYDFYKLLQSNIRNTASKDRDLLKKVANHKKLYFRAGWANYDAAANGELKLIPENIILANLKADYSRMKDMFYNDPIDWDIIINEIREYQSYFNSFNTSR